MTISSQQIPTEHAKRNNDAPSAKRTQSLRSKRPLVRIQPGVPQSADSKDPLTPRPSPRPSPDALPAVDFVPTDSQRNLIRAKTAVCDQLVRAALAGRIVRMCRICGCDDRHVCRSQVRGEPCSWVEPDLCSECARLRTALEEVTAEDPQLRFDLTDLDFVDYLSARARLIEAREGGPCLTQ